MRARPRAIVVVTGSELVRGDRRDENGPFLAAELSQLGVEPARVVLVGDREEELEAALREALEAELCITSGGLGPTHDDRTIELLARVAARPLHVDPALVQEIERVSREIAARLERPFSDFAAGIRKQATLPEGAVSLGLAGTAPGVVLDLGDRVAIALPGPPGELRRLWRRALDVPALARITGQAPGRERRLLRFFGPTESAVARVLDENGGEATGLEVTVCARDLEIVVDFVVEPEGVAAASRMERALRGEFGEALFAEDPRPLEALVLDLARAARVKLSTAESCTGGLVGGRLTSVAGASDVYVGGVVAYANTVKHAALHVPLDVLERHGAVSPEVAAAMARGAKDALGADVAVAVTGIAGPSGGSPEKPVGLVYLHVETPHASIGRRLVLPGDRGAVRERAAAAALHLLRQTLERIRHSPV